jgi:hypothetical protein
VIARALLRIALVATVTAIVVTSLLVWIAGPEQDASTRAAIVAAVTAAVATSTALRRPTEESAR